MSGITLDGRLFMQVRPTSYDAETTCAPQKGEHQKLLPKVEATWCRFLARGQS